LTDNLALLTKLWYNKDIGESMRNILSWFGLNYLLSCGLLATLFIGTLVAPSWTARALPWLTGASAIAGFNFLAALAAGDESCWRFQYALSPRG
jgi:hypothetical protein